MISLQRRGSVEKREEREEGCGWLRRKRDVVSGRRY